MEKNMKLISPKVYEILVSSLEKTIEKHQDSMTTKSVPVNVVVAKEIGLPLREVAVESLKNLRADHNVYDMYRLSDYADALMAYEPGSYSIKKKPIPEPSPSYDDDEVIE